MLLKKLIEELTVAQCRGAEAVLKNTRKMLNGHLKGQVPEDVIEAAVQNVHGNLALTVLHAFASGYKGPHDPMSVIFQGLVHIYGKAPILKSLDRALSGDKEDFSIVEISKLKKNKKNKKEN